jgi:hypothetical protein
MGAKAFPSVSIFAVCAQLRNLLQILQLQKVRFCRLREVSILPLQPDQYRTEVRKSQLRFGLKK